MSTSHERLFVELESKLNTKSKRHQPVLVGTQRGNNECTTWGESKRNITIPCTFWSASRIIRNIVLSNLARCIRGQRHQVTHLTHVCVYWVGPLPSTFSLMHVSLGKCPRQYASRDASRLIGRSGTAGNVKYGLLEIHHRVIMP